MSVCWARLRFRAISLSRQNGFGNALGLGIPAIGQGYCQFYFAAAWRSVSECREVNNRRKAYALDALFILLGSFSRTAFGFQPFQVLPNRQLLLFVFGQWLFRWTECVVPSLGLFGHSEHVESA